MTRKYFSGNSLDQAVLMAARHYGLEPGQLAYRQIEKRHGFLRTRKAVLIAVDPDRPSREAEAPSASLVAPAEPLVPAPVEPLAPVPAEPGPEAPERPREAAGERADGRVGDDGEATPGDAEAPAADHEPEPLDAAVAAASSEQSWDRPAGEASEPRSSAWSGEDDDDEYDDDDRDDDEDDEDDDELEDDDYEAGDEDDARLADGREPEADTELADGREPAAAVAQAPAASGDHDPELLEAAEQAARTLMRFGGIDAEATARSGPERVEVELEGPDSSVLVVENGNGLLAIQHLLPRMMRGLTGRSSFVRVDSEEFHRKRKERLQALALKEAEAVSRDGAPRTLPPMAPDERRIVHLAVQEIPTVVTESRGSGLHKRVMIRLDTADGGHDDIEARHGF